MPKPCRGYNDGVNAVRCAGRTANRYMNEISTYEDWSGALAKSKEGPILLYKHRTGCPACDEAHVDIKEGIELNEIRSPAYIVVAPGSRDIADRIASDLLIEHKTPQAIIVVNGRAAYVADHFDVSAPDIAAMLGKIGEAYRELNDI